MNYVIYMSYVNYISYVNYTCKLYKLCIWIKSLKITWIVLNTIFLF